MTADERNVYESRLRAQKRCEYAGIKSLFVMFQFIPEVSRLQVLAVLLPFLVFCFCFIPYRSVAQKHDKVHLITFENTKADVWFSLLHFILAVNVKMHYICICDWNSSRRGCC